MGSDRSWLSSRTAAAMALALLVVVGGCSSSDSSGARPATTSKPNRSSTSTADPYANPSIITTTAPVTKPLTTVERCRAEVQDVRTAVLAYNVADESTSTWPKSGDDLLFDPRPKPLLGREWMPALPTLLVITGDGTAPPTLGWKPDAPAECSSSDIDLSLTL